MKILIKTLKNKYFCWISFVVSQALYLAMILWTLPKLSHPQLGFLPYDLRPLGYSLEDSTAYLTWLSPSLVEFYLNVQHRLDLFYPLSLFLFFVSYFLIIGGKSRSLNLISKVGLVSSFVLVFFDYAENFVIHGILSRDLQHTAQTIHIASTFTVLKSAGATIATIVALFMAALLLAKLRSNRHGSADR